ncbi:uncharacterized protein RHOBADRAFT_43403 [Rhodotorula graminis WP1]|uniref:Peptide hydrolase n=1 Tax=Rhodotorula graminis (strain WP1) TaxID=578459 RepID=A0A194S999_RHOGW|nr:uncharacterized protein RHOBADRAFT_43403 [Rhodotorula graminis WP1]KPV75971.1 hypothetical protein RHOBADRAFT_43403 [Rhodotorula graminis WP1]
MRPRLRPAWLALALCAAVALAARPRPHVLKRRNPTYAALSDSSLDHLVALSDLDDTLDWSRPDTPLAKLLVPRPVGSANLTRLQAMVEGHFRDLGWHVEKDSFDDSTPYGTKSFTNLVFTHDPSAPRRLVLSAHLDSKFFPTPPEDQFVGATDSAAPCAMLLDLATALTPWLDARKQRVEDGGGEEGREGQGESLQIIFFDGEEAFKDWTHADSIYGARHLAHKWGATTDHSPQPVRATPRSPLRRISHLVLLDLLGAPNPLLRNFFVPTGWLFDEFGHAEERLGLAGYLWQGLDGDAYTAKKGETGARERSFFVPRGSGVSAYAGQIEDDHLPFLREGVPIVHLISVPFPRVWHTIKDDADALDLPTIKAWALIIRLAVAEYLGLDPSAPIPNLNSPTEVKRDPSDLILDV